MLTLVYMVFVVAGLAVPRQALRPARPPQGVRASSPPSLQGVAALLLAFVPDLTVAMVAAGLLGPGLRLLPSVDQALATQVLPDPPTRGKDLGIMNIATAVPQAHRARCSARSSSPRSAASGLFLLAAACRHRSARSPCCR